MPSKHSRPQISAASKFYCFIFSFCIFNSLHKCAPPCIWVHYVRPGARRSQIITQMRDFEKQLLRLLLSIFTHSSSIYKHTWDSLTSHSSIFAHGQWTWWENERWWRWKLITKINGWRSKEISNIFLQINWKFSHFETEILCLSCFINS